MLYQDNDFIIVDKKAKQFVHPMPGVPESKDCLLYEYRDLLGHYLYAVNRLDRPVSGLVILAKRPEVVDHFKNIWHSDQVQKKYLCLHHGHLTHSGQFDSSLSKRGAFKSVNKEVKQEALTLYDPIEFFPDLFCTFTEVEIKTGRYHQIRRHFRKAVMPIVGDSKHGKGRINRLFKEDFNLDQIFLHGHSLEFSHPVGENFISVKSELPTNLEQVLEKLRTHSQYRD